MLKHTSHLLWLLISYENCKQNLAKLNDTLYTSSMEKNDIISVLGLRNPLYRWIGIQYSNAVLLVILHFYTICLYWNRIGTKQDYYYLFFYYTKSHFVECVVKVQYYLYIGFWFEDPYALIRTWKHCFKLWQINVLNTVKDNNLKSWVPEKDLLHLIHCLIAVIILKWFLSCPK